MILAGSAGIARSQQEVTVAARAAGPLADSLRAFGIRMAELLTIMDTDAVLSLYGNHPTFVHVEEGRIIAWPALSAMIREYFRNATSNPIEILGEPGVVIMDSNHAVLYIRHRSGAGGPHTAHQGVWTGVLRRLPEGWKIVHSHSSEPKQ